MNWSDLPETCNRGIGQADEEQIPEKLGASFLCLFCRQRGVRSKDMAGNHGRKPDQLKSSPFLHDQLRRLEATQSGWGAASAVKNVDRDTVWVLAVCRSYKRALGPLKPGYKWL